MLSVIEQHGINLFHFFNYYIYDLVSMGTGEESMGPGPDQYSYPRRLW